MKTPEDFERAKRGGCWQQRLVQRCRTALINACCTLMNLNSRLCYADLDHEIGWRDHVRWWIERRLSAVFCWAFSGSDEELEAVINDEVPERYMSDRQRDYAASLNAAGELPGAKT